MNFGDGGGIIRAKKENAAAAQSGANKQLTNVSAMLDCVRSK
jgi:hypothetical protein